MSWTDERVATLTKMWGEGNSASQIAKELGGVTRNAVIGKVHRLGLSNRATTTTKAKAAPKAAKEAPKTKPKPKEPVRVANPKSTTEIPTARDIPRKRPIITAGQPLPPQPSASEVSAEALAKVVEIEGQAKKLNLMQLTERTCKWPIGDPATDDFWFCGHPVQAGKPYCETHVAVAFQPMSSRRDRRAR